YLRGMPPRGMAFATILLHGGRNYLCCKPLGHICVAIDTEFVDIIGSIRIHCQQPFAHATFEDVTGETGRDRAAKEGIAATFQHVPSLPDSCRDDKLYELSLKRVAAQGDITTGAIRVKQNQAQWITAIEMPDLIIFQLVKHRDTIGVITIHGNDSRANGF